MTKMESKLKEAKGLGSSKSGVTHWWIQRVTSIALAPLVLWMIMFGVLFWAAPYPIVIEKLQSPWVASAFTALILLMLYHGYLGMQVVIEDYVHHEGWKVFLLFFFQFISFFGGIMTFVAIASILSK